MPLSLFLVQCSQLALLAGVAQGRPQLGDMGGLNGMAWEGLRLEASLITRSVASISVTLTCCFAKASTFLLYCCWRQSLAVAHSASLSTKILVKHVSGTSFTISLSWWRRLCSSVGQPEVGAHECHLTTLTDCYQCCCCWLTIDAVVAVLLRLLAVGLQVGDDLVNACIKGPLQEVTLSDTARTLLTVVSLQT